MDLSKKGQESHLFQWIFVLIAGAVLFGFIIKFGFKQSEQATTTSNTEISKALETILRSIERNPDTFKRISIPPSTIEFRCDDSGSYYHLSGSSGTTSLQYNILFSPPKVSGNEILTWTKDWSAPFKVASFLYLSNKRTQYIFVMDPAFQTRLLLNDFPKNFTHLVIDPSDPASPSLSDFRYNNYDHYRFIYINQDPAANPPPPPTVKDNVTILSTTPLLPTTTPDHSDSVYFYRYTPTGLSPPQESFYLRRETLYAALFAHDFQNYACNLKKAIERYKINIDLALLWVQTVSDQIGAGNCRDLFDNTGTPLGIKQHLITIQTELNQLQLADTSSDTTHAKTILEEAKEVKLLNDDLALASCPQLY